MLSQNANHAKSKVTCAGLRRCSDRLASDSRVNLRIDDNVLTKLHPRLASPKAMQTTTFSRNDPAGLCVAATKTGCPRVFEGALLCGKKSQNAILRTVPDIYALEAASVLAFAYHLNFELHVGNVRDRYPRATEAFTASLP